MLDRVASDLSSGLDLAGTPWRRIELSARHDVWCLVDAVDYDWLVACNWNFGWHRNTRWKYYAKRNVTAARSTVYMHREIMIRAAPELAGLAADHHVDHINGNSLDNRRANLQWLTPAANMRKRLARGAAPSLDEIVRELVAGLAPAVDIPF